MDKLIHLSTIFAIGLSGRLICVLDGTLNFSLTKNIKQSLYVMYLTLVVYPIIDHNEYKWLKKVLNKMHKLLLKNFENKSFAWLTIENQFHILQYLIKSVSTLKNELT
ncbi:hypothetical protein RF11_07685 [Thelohanellus kitauei]|uniref:Uncharacterized protein n=1 Tax=Thelohanellus kitauei TaxID=669202 RepID=A0A0C2MK54_THEKT|nr:hypothetical protein RF11_07685 [Thelohanellus kitauei]